EPLSRSSNGCGDHRRICGIWVVYSTSIDYISGRIDADLHRDVRKFVHGNCPGTAHVWIDLLNRPRWFIYLTLLWPMGTRCGSALFGSVRCLRQIFRNAGENNGADTADRRPYSTKL